MGFTASLCAKEQSRGEKWGDWQKSRVSLFKDLSTQENLVRPFIFLDSQVQGLAWLQRFAHVQDDYTVIAKEILYKIFCTSMQP